MTAESIQITAGTSLPFAFALFVQWVGGKVEVFARRSIKSFDAGVKLTPAGEQVPVAFSLYLYDHLSFIFGGFTAVVSCISFTLIGQRPLLAAVGSIVGTAPLLWWVIMWQGLSHTEIQGTRGKAMRSVGWSVIFVVWALALYAQMYPLHAST